MCVCVIPDRHITIMYILISTHNIVKEGIAGTVEAILIMYIIYNFQLTHIWLPDNKQHLRSLFQLINIINIASK